VAREYQDQGTLPGKTYYYVVKSLSSCGSESVPSNEIRVTVEVPNQAPTAAAGLDVNAISGDLVTLTGSGADPDGDPLLFFWRQVSGPAVVLSTPNASRTSFAAPTVASSSSLVFELTVTDTKGATGADLVTVRVAPNHSPIANAGPDRTAEPGQLVHLAGSASDPDGDALVVAWAQISGPSVTLVGASSLSASFSAPPVTEQTGLIFRLSVFDHRGGTASDAVTITVGSSNRNPTANAGPDKTVQSGQVVTLTGSGSDPDGDSLTYSWTQMSGPPATLTASLTSTANCRAPVVSEDTLLVFRLTASDGRGGSGWDDVSVTVLKNHAPKVDAGVDQVVAAGEAVTLSGTASDVDEDPLTLSWTQRSGTAVTLSGVSRTQASFNAPVVSSETQLVFQLSAKDPAGADGTDEVAVTVRPGKQPVADAGSDLTARAGEIVVLNGSGDDPDGGALSFRWAQIGGPTVQVHNADSREARFQAPLTEARVQLSFSLKVTDPTGLSDTDQMNVNVKPNRKPAISLKSKPDVTSGSQVVIEAAVSDPDGDPVTVSWEQTGGAPVELPSAGNSAVFQAPSGFETQMLSIRAVATDGLLNASAETNIKVEPASSMFVVPVSGTLQNSAIERPLVGVALVNEQPEAQDVHVWLLDRDGREHGNQTVNLPLAANAQDAFLVDSVPDFSPEIGSILFTTTTTGLKGFFAVGDYSGTRLDGVSGNLRKGKELFFPVVPATEFQTASLALYNEGGEPADIRLTVRDGTNGRELKGISRPISAHGTLATSLKELFPSTSIPPNAYVRVESASELRGFELVADSQACASLSAQVAVPTDVLWVPHFLAKERGGNTVLRVLNAETTLTAPLKIEAFDDEGKLLGLSSLTLRPGEMTTRDLEDIMGSGFEGDSTGYLKISVKRSLFDSGSRRLFGAVTYSGNGGQFSSSVEMLASGSSKVLFPQLAQSKALSIFTGLALVNPGSETAIVQLVAYRPNGVKSQEVTVSVPPASRLVDLLNGKRFFGSGFDQVNGHLRITSNVPLLSVVLFGDYASSYLAAVEGIVTR